MPMQRWMASAAGGTSHRLNPGLAIMRSLERNAGWSAMPSAVMLVLIVYPPVIGMARQPCITLSLIARKARLYFLVKLHFGATLSRRRTRSEEHTSELQS